MKGKIRFAIFSLICGISFCGQAFAAPRGVIKLNVDATEAARRIFHSRLAIPVEPGALMLLFPKWIPGEHAPSGPVTDLAGLRITAGGRELAWRRDDTDMYVLRCQVPAGTTALEVSFDFLSAPSTATGFSAAASATSQLAVLSWNQLLLYPGGSRSSELQYQVELALPEGWKYGTALPVESSAGSRIRFAAVSLETLIDSPLLCGKHFREVRIGPPGDDRQFIEMACDGEEGLAFPPELKEKYDRLVSEALALFGARHYDTYRFLLTLSDYVTHFGLEHHQSSDDRTAENSLVDADQRLVSSTLMPHEYIHSWNGKYRRPEGMVTADYQQPQKTGLLWVYEGLTHYLEVVLTARSGLMTEGQARDMLAWFANWVQCRKGRSWRPLFDTTVSAQLLYDARKDWAAWRRGVDFYREGVFIWLEADAIIRRQSGGRKSLDDFCQAFFGGGDSPPEVKPYTLEELVSVLNSVAPYDWKPLFGTLVNQVSDQAPLAGLESAGWRLVFRPERSGYLKALENTEKYGDLSASVGIEVKDSGMITDIIPGTAADKAGLAPGTKIVAVNSRRYSLDLLRRATAATVDRGVQLELLVENGDYMSTYKLDYSAGEKYPTLERADSQPDLLSAILAPRTRSGN